MRLNLSSKGSRPQNDAVDEEIPALRGGRVTPQNLLLGGTGMGFPAGMGRV